MNLDRDLRDALQPLAGDPVAAAARVLGALGARRRRRAPPRPLVWWLVGAAFACGLGAGWVWRALLTGAAAPLPHEAAPGDARPGPAAVEPRATKPQDEAAAKGEMAGFVQFVAVDRLEIDEPGDGVQDLEPGVYRARVGTKFTTRNGVVSAFAFANEARLRLDAGTVATFEPDTVTLTAGRLWFSDRTRPALAHVRTDLAVVEVRAATALVERRGDTLWVCSLGGPVTVTGAGGPVRLTAMQQVEVARGGAGPVTKVPFAGALTGWMVPLLLLETDNDELQQRGAEMVAAWVDGTHRDAAAIELRRLGATVVPTLYKALDEVAGDPALHRRAAALLADLAGFRQAAWLFALLESDDADVRAIAFGALVRVTGSGVGTEAFWREASRDERAAALPRWRGEVR